MVTRVRVPVKGAGGPVRVVPVDVVVPVVIEALFLTIVTFVI